MCRECLGSNPAHRPNNLKRKELIDMSKKRKGEMNLREMKKIEKIKEANRKALIEAWQKGKV